MDRFVLGLTESKRRTPKSVPVEVLWVTSSNPSRTIFPERLAVPAFNPKKGPEQIEMALKQAAKLLRIRPDQIEIDDPLVPYCKPRSDDGSRSVKGRDGAVKV